MRFSLKWMLASVAFIGSGCTALYNANEAWAMATFGLTAFVLLVAVVGSIYSNSRAYYVGMAVFGWGYLLLTEGPIRPLASTNIILDSIYVQLSRDIPDVPRGDIPEGAAFVKRGIGFTYWMPVREHFRAVGSCLLVLILAVIGGSVGQWFSRQRCNSASEP